MFLNEIEFLQRVVKIPSVTGNESLLANFLVDQFRNWGIESSIDDVGNVIASVGSGERVLILTSHMDTVPGNVPVRVGNGNLYGRGSVDAKSGLAAFAYLLREFINSENLKIIFIGVVDEEGESRGARNVLNRFQPDFVINGEPSGWNGITIGYRGCIKFDCSIHVEERHSSSQKSAFLILNEFVNRIRNYIGNDEPSFSSTNIEVPNICGNAHQATIRMMTRIPVGFDIGRFREFVNGNREGVDVQWIVDTPGVLLGKNNILVRGLISAIREEGGNPIFKKKTGTSDMNLFSRWRCPVVSYAAGDSKLDHTPNEHINIEEFRRSVRVLRNTILGLERKNISPESER
jgi:[amino group carrier protein]-lysine/ornithine hydrolase